MKVLIVLTSHSALGTTGEKTGFWIEEFATPYYVLADAGRNNIENSKNIAGIIKICNGDACESIVYIR